MTAAVVLAFAVDETHKMQLCIPRAKIPGSILKNVAQFLSGVASSLHRLEEFQTSRTILWPFSRSN
jgi:hypothetical protein